MTSQVAPATIFNDLMHRSLHFVSSQPSELDLRRTEREAQKLMAADASGAREILAHLAGAKNDTAEADRLYESALAGSDEPASSAFRYLALLAWTGRTEKLLEQFNRFRSLLRNDPGLVRDVSRMLMGTGWVETAAAFRAEGVRLGLEVEEDHRTALIVGDDKMPEAEVAKAVGTAYRFLRDRGAAPHAVGVSVVRYEDGGASLFYQLLVDRDPTEVAEIEWSLFEALGEEELRADVEGAVLFSLGAAQRGLPDAHHM